MMTVLLVLYFNLGNLGQPVELLGYMRPYYMVLFASLPFVMLFNAFKQFTDSITLTGGCAKNAGLKQAIEHVLKFKVVELKTDPQLMGALGAAEYARQKGLAKSNHFCNHPERGRTARFSLSFFAEAQSEQFWRKKRKKNSIVFARSICFYDQIS